MSVLPCVQCGRPTRPKHALSADHPGTVQRHGNGMCEKCKYPDMAARAKFQAIDTEWAGHYLPGRRVGRSGRTDPDAVLEDDGYIDPVAIQRALDACWPCPRLTPRETHAVVIEGTVRGWYDQALADRLGISERQVTRLRGRYGVAIQADPEAWMIEMAAQEAA